MNILELIANAVQQILSHGGNGNVSITTQSTAKINSGKGVVTNVVYNPTMGVVTGGLAIGSGSMEAVGSVMTNVGITSPEPIQQLQQLQAAAPLAQLLPPSGGGETP